MHVQLLHPLHRKWRMCHAHVMQSVLTANLAPAAEPTTPDLKESHSDVAVSHEPDYDTQQLNYIQPCYAVS